MTLEEFMPLRKRLHIADIGAALLGETPPYKPLMDRRLAHLSAFDGDERQKHKLVELYGENFDYYGDIIADGKPHTLRLMHPDSGMSSILKPSEKHLAFFNGFSFFGIVQQEVPVKSRRLDDIEELNAVDFLKIDIQGAELMVLKHAKKKLKKCVAIQLEVSFVPLYRGQPSFGEIDLWMRENGYLPHCFAEVKRWSIAPTVRNGNFRLPFNQLLEADVVYIKDPLQPDGLSNDDLRNLTYISHYCYNSVDLAMHCLLELEKRGDIAPGTSQKLFK